MNDNKHTLTIIQTMCFYNITSMFYDINKSEAISIDCYQERSQIVVALCNAHTVFICYSCCPQFHLHLPFKPSGISIDKLLIFASFIRHPLITRHSFKYIFLRRRLKLIWSMYGSLPFFFRLASS